MKKIKILDCGPSLKDVSNQFGQSPEWIMNNLKNYDCEFEWIKIYSDQKIKNISGDAWIITGSPRSVYDQEEWMLDLEENIKNAGINDFPILGICFGHQIIAKSFGGRVDLNPLGWELGSYPIYLTDEGSSSPLFKNIPSKSLVYESHKDYVSVLPENAVQLAFNDKCIQSFQLFDRIYSVQFHPEFSLEIMKKYVSIRSASGAKVDDPYVSKSTQSFLILQNFIDII